MWTSVADLFTPTSLFLFLNLTIAAIAITSRKNKHPDQSDHHHHHFYQPHHHHEQTLHRAPSLLERVRSLNFNFSPSYDSDADHHSDEGPSSHPSTPTARALDRASSLFKSMNHFSPLRRSSGPGPETEDQNDDGSSSSLPATPTARALERASSLLKSINHFSPLRRPDPEAEDHHHLFVNDDESYPSSSHTTTPTARALERASSLFKSINPLRRPDPETEDHHHLFTNDDGSSTSPSPSSSLPTTPTARALERASSIFKSLNHFSSPLSRSSGPDPGTEHRVGDRDHDDRQVKRSRSESEVAAVGGGGRRMMKSASEKCTAEVVAAVAVEEEKEDDERRRPATVRLQKAVSIGDDHGVDSKADDFINRFKQQLKLQRLDSLMRNRELLRAQQQHHTAS